MPLPSFLKRAAPDGEAPGVAKSESAALVQARRRLMGAAVLLAVGVVVFPLLFESKPRPLPTDLPMQYAPTALRGADAAPVAPVVTPGRVAPAPSSAGKTVGGATPAAAGSVAAPGAAVTSAGATAAVPGISSGDASPAAVEPAIDEAAPPAPSPSLTTAVSPAPTAAPAPSTASAVAPASGPSTASPSAAAPGGASRAASSSPAAPAAAKGVTPAAIPAAKGATPAATVSAGVPSKAGPPAPAAGSASPGKDSASVRYIVQVGAFADAAAAREVRLKVERLGFTTYTHVIDVPGGQRIRVRVGPMTDRAQAQRTLDKIKQAGLPGALLRL